MLEITDINTDSSKSAEVERLKKEFESYLSGTANEASVVILCNVPAIGNIAGHLDYIFFVNIRKKPGNYLRLKRNGEHIYVDSFILLVKKVIDNSVENADDRYIYNRSGAFDYNDSVRINNRDFQEYCRQFEEIKCFTLYQFSTAKPINYYNEKVLINYDLTAKSIVWCAANQFSLKYSGYRVNSFNREALGIFHGDQLIAFVKTLVDSICQKTKYGILTKRKLDRISTSVKVVDDVYENIGTSLSIITGKAGTGKTLTLSRIIHKHASNSHNIRLLTFNNLLVFDLKQTLRNFGYFGDPRISLQTVHQFFYRLAEKLGIPSLLSENRVDELIDICEKRIESLRQPYAQYLNTFSGFFVQNDFLKIAIKHQKNKPDYDEFREFAKFLATTKGLDEFDKLKSRYLAKKRQSLIPYIGTKYFLEDYYKVLELVYMAVSDPRQFYEELHIKDRYTLLSTLYNADKFKDNESDEITYENMEWQVSLLKRTSNWSKLMIVDECQDFHVLEKEILYKLRGSDNIVVASGGKEQLIRHPHLLDWSLSLTKPIPFRAFPLSGGSYRQKHNIIAFVNQFAESFGLSLNLKSVSESEGLGSVLIDTRKKTAFINTDVANQMRNNGEINGCSPYESTLFLIPSQDYTKKNMSTSFHIDEKDFLEIVNVSTNRHVNNIDQLTELGYNCWDGVSESKSTLTLPFQTESRVIHYESSRGLEAWSCACLSLDAYFDFKMRSKEAEKHLSGDMYLSADERRNNYAALWCLMAFTRPIDTLYIHLNDPDSPLSKKLLSIASRGEGITVY